jgi:hypothetical protein
MSARHRNSGCRIREFTWRGHRCVTLENETLRILVAADKGADILEFLHKPTDTECLWQSPSGLRPPVFFPSTPLEPGYFREYFAGGWYEMLPNGPEPCEHRGARFGYHGEATLLPWDTAIETDEPECIRVRLTARLTRMPLMATKILELRSGSGTLFLTETIRSEAGHDVELLWGQHPTFGPPLLEPGARVFLPRCAVITPASTAPDARVAPDQKAEWPLVRGVKGEVIDLSVIPARGARSHDFVRLENLEDGWYAVVNPARRVGFALKYDEALFPVLGYWQLFHGGDGYPWYQRHFLAALEPACDLPSLNEAAKRGTAIAIAPGNSLETTFEATAFAALEHIRSVHRGGDIVQE